MYAEPTQAYWHLYKKEIHPLFAEVAARETKRSEQILIYPTMASTELTDAWMVALLSAHVQRLVRRDRILKPRGILAVDGRQAEDDRSRMLYAAKVAGFRTMQTVEAAYLAALGSHIPSAGRGGYLVMDIGAEKTELSLIGRDGLLDRHTMISGCCDLDHCLMQGLMHEEGILIDPEEAAALKFTHTVLDTDDKMRIINGRDARDGSSKRVVIRKERLQEWLTPIRQSWSEALLRFVMRNGSEEARRIIQGGLLLVGGGAMLPEMGEWLRHHSAMAVHIPPAADQSVARGLVRVAQMMEEQRGRYKPIDVNTLLFG